MATNTNNIVFYFKSYDELEAFAFSHPELWINVLGTTQKGWFKALVSRIENTNAEQEQVIPVV